MEPTNRSRARSDGDLGPPDPERAPESPLDGSLLATLMQRVADGIAVFDAAGNLVQANEAARRIARWTQVEESPREFGDWDQVCEPDGSTIEPPDQPLARALTGESIRGRRVRMSQGDADPCHLLLSATPVRSDEGGVVGAVVIFAEDAQPVELPLPPPPAAVTGRFRSTLDRLLEGFQIIDRDWLYLYVNPAAAVHGGTTPEALVGRTLGEAYPGIYETPLFAILERCMNERTIEIFESRFVLPGGDSRWFELRVEPVPEGLCVHSIDIQERKEAEQRLADLNAQLADQVERRSRAVEVLHAELEVFSCSISHDLKEPLRSVEGFSRLLAEDHGDRLDEAGLDALGRIRAASQRLAAMVDGLVSLSRINRHVLAVEPVSLSDLAHSVGEELRSQHEDREVTLSIDGDLYDHGDPRLLRLALRHLLGNAWKFTAPRRVGRVVFGATEADGRRVYYLRDNGVGFDPGHAHELFMPFRRLHRTADFAGNGMGLALVRRVIHRHGGEIWAQAKLEGGATFYFTLDRRPAEASP